MNPLLIYISPLLILLFTAVLTFATTTNLRRNRTLAFIGLAVSMVLNTLFLIYPSALIANLESEILSTNSTNIWIVELILMIGFYNFMVVDTELDALLLENFFINRQYRATRITEYRINTVINQRPDNHFRSGHFHVLAHFSIFPFISCNSSAPEYHIQ